MNGQSLKIVVVKNRALGDAILTFGAIQYLRALYPHAEISFLTPAWTAPLFKNIDHSANRIIGFNLKNAFDWIKTIEILQSIKPDVIIEFFQSGRTKTLFSLYSKLHSTQYFFHNHHTKNGKIHDQGVIKANIQRDLDTVWSYTNKTPPYPNFLEFNPSLKVKDPRHKNHIIFGVVATRKTKRWELKNFTALSHLLKDEEILIPISQSQVDQEIKKELLTQGINGKFLEVSLEELPLYIANAKLYIGNDTGIKHLSAALNIPTYTFFGPEPPLEWHPYDTATHPYYFKHPLECRTISAHYCGLETCESMICLNEFTAEDLYQELNKKRML